MFDAVKNIKILIDEDLSPAVARNLSEELLIDAVAVRDRGLLGTDDRSILEYAFNDDRILVTANVGDFERFARACEVHAGIIFITEGDLLPRVEKHLPLTPHMQVADTPGRHEPGTGEVNWPFVFRRIDELGFKGWIGCEYRPRNGTRNGLGWFAPYRA